MRRLFTRVRVESNLEQMDAKAKSTVEPLRDPRAWMSWHGQERNDRLDSRFLRECPRRGTRRAVCIPLISKHDNIEDTNSAEGNEVPISHLAVLDPPHFYLIIMLDFGALQIINFHQTPHWSSAFVIRYYLHQTFTKRSLRSISLLTLCPRNLL